MSEVETHIGKLKVHTPVWINGEVGTLEQQCEHILKTRLKENPNIKFNIEDYDSWKEALLDGPFYKNFAICKNRVLEIIKDKSMDCEDISFAAKENNSRNIYNYVVQYYNGGCCLSEAIEDAMADVLTKEEEDNND